MRSALQHVCVKQAPSASISFVRANLAYVPDPKCRGQSNLGLCTISELANRMPRSIGKFRQILQPNTLCNQNSRMRSCILLIVHRTRSDYPLHFDIRNIEQIRMENEFPIAQRLLPADKLERWPQVCCVKITFGLLLTNPFISDIRV